MPIPASLTPITVTARYVKADGSPAAGSVRFQLSAAAAVPVDQAMVPVTSVKATLDAAGAFSVTLAASDDPDWAQDGLTYQVTERITGAELRTYNIDLRADAPGGTVDLASLAPAVPGPPLVSYVLAATVGAVGGPAGPLDATGKLPASQVPASASPVQSVAGKTGEVVLAAGDVAGVETPDGAQDKANAALVAAITAAATDATTKANAAEANATAASAQRASNLADLSSPSTARTNLGLGGAATRDVGTATGTVAAGDDARIAGAAQKASNLSDLANTATARTNLGLGDSATRNVGTTAGTVAAGDDSRIVGAAADSAVVHKGDMVVNVKDAPYNVKGDGTEEGAAIQAAITAILDAGYDAVLPPGTYKSNTGLSWDPTKGSVYGLGRVVLDFTGLASGYAITLDCADSAAFRAIEHSIGGFRVLGPQSDTTTVDGFRFTGTTNSSMIELRDISVNGFRDAFYFDQNTWTITLHRVIAGHFARYGINFDSTTNAGENYNFYGCTFFNSRNATTGAATAVYTSPTGDVDATFHSCSFDYNDYAVLHQGGKLWFNGCHFEDNGANPFIRLTRTSDPANPRTTLGLFGGVFVQTEGGNGRDHLIQCMPGTFNGDVYLSMLVTVFGTVFDTNARTTTVFKNLSTVNPRVTHFGCQLNNTGNSTQSATMGHYTSLLVNGDFEGSTTFAGSSAFPMYPGQNWARDGTVTYSFDTAVKRSGTKSLKIAGTGTAVSGTGLKQMIAVIPGRELLVTFWVRADAMTGGNAFCRVAWYLNDHSTRLAVAYQSPGITASQDWTAYKARLIVPPGITLALVDVVSADLNGTLYVDDVVATMP